MKILHVAGLLNPEIGIVNQMLMEQYAAEGLSINWKVRLFSQSDIPSQILEKYTGSNKGSRVFARLLKLFHFKKQYYDFLRRSESEHDALLLRYSMYDPFQLLFLYRCKKPVFLVHHTLETKEIALARSFDARVKLFLEKVLGFFSIKLSAGCVVVTSEIGRYERSRSSLFASKPVFIYPNGITYKKKVLVDRRRPDSLNMLFVASSFEPWQGLDLLLREITASKDEFTLHVIGRVHDEDKYIIRGDSRVVFYGSQCGEEINRVASLCDIGLSSLALHRMDMFEACALKVREYLELGLPVYGAYDEVLPPGFPYYLKGEVDIKKIINFAKKCKLIPKDRVSHESKPHVEKKMLLEKLYEDICHSDF